MNRLTKKITWGVLGFIVLLLILGSVGQVSAGTRGVHTRFGSVTGRIIQPGIYFKVPFIEGVQKMDVRVQKEEVLAASASSDLQSVSTVIALNYRLDTNAVAELFENVGLTYNLRIIAPTIQESVKASTAKFTAEELITKRAEVRDSIKVSISEKLNPHGILVEEFNIVNFSFSEAFDAAIERKVTAEQEALAAQNKLEQVKFEAQQNIETAKGKAEAIRIEAQALSQNPRILELRAVEKWDGIMPKVTGGSIPFVNID